MKKLSHVLITNIKRAETINRDQPKRALFRDFHGLKRRAVDTFSDDIEMRDVEEDPDKNIVLLPTQDLLGADGIVCCCCSWICDGAAK